jgi:hypothetical protein
VSHRWFELQQGQETFLFSEVVWPALEPTQPPMQWAPVFLLGVTDARHAVYHTFPPSTKVKNIPLLPLHVSQHRQGWVLMLHDCSSHTSIYIKIWAECGEIGHSRCYINVLIIHDSLISNSWMMYNTTDIHSSYTETSDPPGVTRGRWSLNVWKHCDAGFKFVIKIIISDNIACNLLGCSLACGV